MVSKHQWSCMSGGNPKSRTLTDQLVDLRTECESLRSQNALQNKEMQIHESELTELKKQNAEIKNENTALIEKNKFLSAHSKNYNELKDKLDTMNSTNISLNTTINTYKQAVQDIENKNKQLIQTLRLLTNKTSQSEIENASNKKEIDQHKQKHSHQNTIITQLQDDLDILQSQLTTIQTQRQQIPVVEDEKDIHLPALPDLEMPTEIRARRTLPDTLNVFGDTTMFSQLTQLESIPDEPATPITAFMMQRLTRSIDSIHSHSPLATGGVYNEIENMHKEVSKGLFPELEQVKKECQMQKQQIKRQLNIIKQLKAKNVRLIKRLTTGRNSCNYIFDFFDS
eukprot:193751_1